MISNLFKSDSWLWFFRAAFFYLFTDYMANIVQLSLKSLLLLSLLNMSKKEKGVSLTFQTANHILKVKQRLLFPL